MPQQTLTRLILLTLSLLLAACGGDGGGVNPTGRSFAMGFTPWPYAATQTAVDDTYAKVNANGDIIAHHLDSGIPWQEALDGVAYPAAVESEIAAKVSNTPASKKVYLAISPLNTSRTAMADYWNDSGTGQPLPAPWSGYDFTSTQVQTAYINFATDLINRFNPDYFNFGIEASELILNDAKNGTLQYSNYLTFVDAVSTALRASFPNLKLMISVALKHPSSTDTQTLTTWLPFLIQYVDVVGASVYPYVFFGHANAGDPANLPSNWLSQLQDIAGSKPVAVTETGWIAEELVIPSLNVNVPATAANQDAYVQDLFREAQALNAKFVIWWCVVDFDDLWTNALGQDPIAQIWRDTGLYDGTVTARPALATWQEQLAVSLTP
jgi:hypothetical protein